MQRIRSSGFLSATLVLASGTALAQAIPILLMPVLSRLFTPEDFGVLGVFTAFIGFAATVVALSFPLAIVSDTPRHTSARLTMISLAVSGPMSILLALVLLVLREQSVLGFGVLPRIAVLWTWLSLLFIGVFTAFRYWQVREQSFGRISRATVAQSLGRTIAQLAAGAASLGGGGLIAAELAGRVTGVSSLARASWSDLRHLTRGSRRPDYLAVVREFRKFPLLSTPSSMLDSLSMALLVPLITSVFGLAISGQFSMAYRTLALPIAVVGAAVADVFHARIAELAASSMPQARRLFLRVAGVLLSAGILPAIAIAIWGEWLFALVLGDQWAQAGVLAAAIIPWLLASFVVGPLSRVVLVFRGQEVKLVYDVLALASVVGVVLLGDARGLTIEATARMLGATQTVAYCVYFLLLWHIMRTATTRPASDS